VGGGKKYGGVYTMFVPLIFVPFVLLFWASSVLSYIPPPPFMTWEVLLYKSYLVGWICLETMASLSN